jgi:hypothetical protein
MARSIPWRWTIRVANAPMAIGSSRISPFTSGVSSCRNATQSVGGPTVAAVVPSADGDGAVKSAQSRSMGPTRLGRLSPNARTRSVSGGSSAVSALTSAVSSGNRSRNDGPLLADGGVGALGVLAGKVAATRASASTMRRSS